jgi:hypothetical protein
MENQNQLFFFQALQVLLPPLLPLQHKHTHTLLFLFLS